MENKELKAKARKLRKPTPLYLANRQYDEAGRERYSCKPSLEYDLLDFIKLLSNQYAHLFKNENQLLCQMDYLIALSKGDSFNFKEDRKS